MSVAARRRLPALIVAAVLAAGVLVAAVALMLTRVARAQVDVTIDATMTKGPATAAVTIVEFSDYQ